MRRTVAGKKAGLLATREGLLPPTGLVGRKEHRHPIRGGWLHVYHVAIFIGDRHFVLELDPGKLALPDRFLDVIDINPE